MSANDHAIALLLLYGNVVQYGDGRRIAFSVPKTDNWRRTYAYADDMHTTMKRWMWNAVLRIEDENSDQ